jgi:DNA-binding MarR family transcriptional regulator
MSDTDTPFVHRNLPRLLLEAREAFLLGPSLTGVLTRMERDGLIERSRCPQDARRTVVRATSAGLKLVKALSGTIESHYAWMEQRLGKARLEQLYTLLDEVIALEQPMEAEVLEA